MLVGWSKPDTTVVTFRFGSTIVGPSGDGSDDVSTVSVPKRPCFSLPIPAVKNKLLEVVFAAPRPNCSADARNIDGLTARVTERAEELAGIKIEGIDRTVPEVSDKECIIEFAEALKRCPGHPPRRVELPLAGKLIQ